MTRYIVRSGDTLTKIARQFGITVQAIVDANAIPDPNRIATGAVLSIPNSSDILAEFMPTQTRVPVTIDNSTGAPMAEVLVTARRPAPPPATVFDLSEWLRPPKVYLGLAVLIGVALLLSGGSHDRD